MSPVSPLKNLSPAESPLCTQLDILNERIRMYAARIWQLPTAYFSAIAIAAFNIEKDTPANIVKIISGFSVVTGIILILLLYSYRHRINKLVAYTKHIEKELAIPVTSVAYMYRAHFSLYLLIILGGMLASVLIALFTIL